MSDSEKGLCPVCRKRRLTEDVQQECITIIIQQNFDTLFFPLLSSNIHLNESNSDGYDDMIVLRQILEDIFVQLENEQHIIYTSSIIDKSSHLISADNSSIDMIEIENIYDNDALMPLNDLVPDIISSDTSYKDSIDNEMYCSSTYIQTSRPPCVKISITGVEFITDQELKFVDQQRSLLNDDIWLPDGAVGKSKPSSTWFTGTRAIWLRAIYSGKKYILCIMCAQEPKCNSRLVKNKGAFISHPYWKLLHKGLEGD